MPFDSKFLRKFLNSTQGKRVDRICCLQCNRNKLIELLDKSIDLLHSRNDYSLLVLLCFIFDNMAWNHFVVVAVLSEWNVSLIWILSCSNSFSCTHLLYILQPIIWIYKLPYILFHLQDLMTLTTATMISVHVQRMLELLKITVFHFFVLIY